MTSPASWQCAVHLNYLLILVNISLHLEFGDKTLIIDLGVSCLVPWQVEAHSKNMFLLPSREGIKQVATKKVNSTCPAMIIHWCQFDNSYCLAK